MNTTICELCCNTGGAYKATDEPGKWTHTICASWIPEIYLAESDDSIFTLKGVDRRRFKLRCVLCTGKGACIQCSYGKCCIPAHPWCVLHTPKGFRKRVIKDENGQIVWDIFCKAHATAVSEPHKPKVKQKSSASSAPAAVVPLQTQESLEEKIKNRRGDRKSSKPKYSMSHCMRITAPPKGPVDGSKSSNAKESSRNGSDDSRKKKKSRESDDENEDSEEHEEEDDEASVKLVAHSKSLKIKSTGKTVKQREVQNTNVSSSSNAAPTQTFPLLTLVEWPGQAEGEAMDLDHFWNVASMHYPEDHSLQVMGDS